MGKETYTDHNKETFIVSLSQMDALLSRYGHVERFETDSGARITVLPTCEIPVEHLLPENWDITTPVGNFRSVKSIDRLHDGTKPGIYIKGPERVFTREERSLNQDYVWWGGRFSGEKAIDLGSLPVIEEQTV